MVDTITKHVREDFSKEQRNSLVNKLNESDLFKFTPLMIIRDEGWVKTSIGWIDVKKPLYSHPRFNGRPLPVGFISANNRNKEKYYLELVNNNERFPEDYHSRLRAIYLSLK